MALPTPAQYDPSEKGFSVLSLGLGCMGPFKSRLRSSAHSKKSCDFLGSLPSRSESSSHLLTALHT